MSSGAGQSGNPCPRFTAPYFAASRLISRMTDSVNDAALCEIRCFETLGWVIERERTVDNLLLSETQLGRTNKKLIFDCGVRFVLILIRHRVDRRLRKDFVE